MNDFFRLSFRYFLVSLFVSLLIILKPVTIITPVMANPLATGLQEAQVLIQQGQLKLNSGKAQIALETWGKATNLYRQLDDEGLTGFGR